MKNKKFSLINSFWTLLLLFFLSSCGDAFQQPYNLIKTDTLGDNPVNPGNDTYHWLALGDWQDSNCVAPGQRSEKQTVECHDEHETKVSENHCTKEKPADTRVKDETDLSCVACEGPTCNHLNAHWEYLWQNVACASKGIMHQEVTRFYCADDNGEIAANPDGSTPCDLLIRGPLERDEAGHPECLGDAEEYTWKIERDSQCQGTTKVDFDRAVGCLNSEDVEVNLDFCKDLPAVLENREEFPNDPDCAATTTNDCEGLDTLLATTFTDKATIFVNQQVNYSPLTFHGFDLNSPLVDFTGQSVNTPSRNPNWFVSYLKSTMENSIPKYRVFGLDTAVAYYNNDKGLGETALDWSSDRIRIDLCADSVDPLNCSRDAASGFKISFTNLPDPNVDKQLTSIPDKSIFHEILKDSHGTEMCRIVLNSYSPLVLDVTGRGISFESPNSTMTYFDILGNGEKKRIACLQSGAFLALPKNGRIESIHELFGNNTRGPYPFNERAENGFQALAKYNNYGLLDDNFSGRNQIDKKDSIFPQLRLWRDINCDGKNYNDDGSIQEDEMQSLEDAHIESIDLDYVKGYFDAGYGNEIQQRSTYSLKDGSQRQIFDVWFVDQE